MRSEVGRRAFVGTMAAGLPVLATTASIAQSGSGSHVHASGAGDWDPVTEHVTRELAAVLNRVRERGPRAEDMRVISGQLRTFAAYGKQLDLDGRVRRELRAAVAAKGRDGVLYAEPNKGELQACLKRFGLEGVELPFGRAAAVDYATRARILDEGLRTGITPKLQLVARAFDALAVDLDERARQGLARRVQDDDGGGTCQHLETFVTYYEVEVVFMCALVWFWPALGGLCAMMSIFWVIASVTYHIAC